jgi:hypothetical protein
MDSNDDAYGTLVLDLDGDGPGGFYRVRNRKGQINREAIINRGEKFQVMADLVEVTHGTLNVKPDGTAGDDAALLVADFHFVPKRGRRYKGATVKFIFTSADPLVEVSVEKIAPYGCWTKNPTTRDDKFSWSLKPSVEPPGVGGISVGEVSSSQGQTKTFHTFVDGTMRMETRDEGGKDTAQWVLSENEAQSTGIARSFRVAILVKLAIDPKRKTTEPIKFSATVEAIADVPFTSLGWVEEKVESIRKKVPVDDPVVFKRGVDLESGVFKFDKTNLRGEDLTKVMAMDLYHSFEAMDKAKQES